MRLLGAVFAVALVGLTAGYVRRRGCSWLETVLLALPLAVSLYTFSSGAWLLPDDAAWLAVLGILIIALGPTRRAWLFGGVVLPRARPGAPEPDLGDRAAHGFGMDRRRGDGEQVTAIEPAGTTMAHGYGGALPSSPLRCRRSAR